MNVNICDFCAFFISVYPFVTLTGKDNFTLHPEFLGPMQHYMTCLQQAVGGGRFPALSPSMFCSLVVECPLLKKNGETVRTLSLHDQQLKQKQKQKYTNHL